MPLKVYDLETMDTIRYQNPMLVIMTKKNCAPQAKFFSSREEKKFSRAKIIQKVHDFKKNKNKKKFPDFPEISSSWDWKQMIFFFGLRRRSKQKTQLIVSFRLV